MEVQFGVSVGYFLWSLLLGFVLAFLYDLLRTARRIFRAAVWVVNLEDIFFFVLCGLLLLWTAYEKNSGRLRWQGFLGAGAAFYAYRHLLKEHMVCFLTGLYEKIVQGICAAVRLILFPVRLVYRILSKPFYIIVWYSKKQVHRAGDRMKTRKKQREIRHKCKVAEKNKKKRERDAKKQAEIQAARQAKKPKRRPIHAARKKPPRNKKFR